MKKLFQIFLIYIFSFGICLANNNEKLPVEIVSDSLEILQDKNKAVFKGSVVAVQGDISMNADEMHVYYASKKDKIGNTENSISKVETIDHVVLKTKDETAKSDLGIYDANKNEITLSGNVSLIKGKNVVKGTKLVYNLDTKTSNLIGNQQTNSITGEKTKRVKGVFTPNN